MKQTLLVKLAPSKKQYSSLIETMERFNEACNHVSNLAFQNKTKSQVKLHHLIGFLSLLLMEENSFLLKLEITKKVDLIDNRKGISRSLALHMHLLL